MLVTRKQETGVTSFPPEVTAPGKKTEVAPHYRGVVHGAISLRNRRYGELAGPAPGQLLRCCKGQLALQTVMAQPSR